MTDQNEVGRAKIVVEADASSLKASLQDAKKQTEKLGDASDKASKKINKNAKDSASKIGAMAGSLSKVQETFSKLVIPIALATGISALIKKVFELRKEAELFKKQLDSISDVSFENLRSILVSENFDEVGQSLAALEEQRRKEVERTLEAFETKSQSTLNAIRSGIKDIVGLDLGFDRDDAENATKKAIDEINARFDTLAEKQKAALKAEAAERERIAKEEEERINAAEEIKMLALQERIRRENQAADERNAQQIEAAAQAAEAFASRFDQVFGADFTTRLDTIAAAISRNTSGLGRLK